MPAPNRLRLPPASLLALLGLAGCRDVPPSSDGAVASSSSHPSASAGAPSASSAPAASGSAAAPKPAPIDGALPAGAPHGLDRRAECVKEGCTLAHLVPDEVRPALSDGAPVVIWEQAIAERATVVFPRDEVVDLAGVVLDGSVDLKPMEGTTARTVGGRWAAFSAPGGGVTLGGTGGKAARVALVVAVAGAASDARARPQTGLAAHLDRRDRPGAPPSWSWKARPRPVETFSFEARPDLAWGDGAYHARIGGEDGGRAAVVLDLLRFSGDAGVAEHVHETSWESLAVLEGEGALVRRPAAGEERVEVRPGTIVTIPAGVRHAWKPSGKGPFFAIQAYAPPGPEQRFKQLAGKGP